MKRTDYAKILTDNAREHFNSVIPLEAEQHKGFISWCKRNDTPSGNDRVKSFL